MIRSTLSYTLDRLPYVGRLRRMLREAGLLLREAGAFPLGHFYSPIPNHAEVLRRVESMRAQQFEVRDIRFNQQEQFDVLQRFAAFYGDLPFPTYRSEACRDYYDQTAFCYPDAIFLYSFLREMAGDLLFIDSSHVLKCGSDLQFLLFEVLPNCLLASMCTSTIFSKHSSIQRTGCLADGIGTKPIS